MAKEKHGIEMPEDISEDPIQAEVWRQVVGDGSAFAESDVPVLRQLCWWHAVEVQAQRAISRGDGHISIFDKVGNKPFKTEDGRPIPMLRGNPALGIAEQATKMTKSLREHLGITAQRPVTASGEPANKRANVLKLALNDRAERERKAAR